MYDFLCVASPFSKPWFLFARNVREMVRARGPDRWIPIGGSIRTYPESPKQIGGGSPQGIRGRETALELAAYENPEDS